MTYTQEIEESGPFEGPEKLLELWFAPDEAHVASLGLRGCGTRPARAGVTSGGTDEGEPWLGLRQVPRETWDSMLDEVHCKVLSVIEGNDMDGYLLSESSMFVWPHKLILKTCGTTTLLLGLPTLLRIASEVCGFAGVWRCFYSRKSFLFPERQLGPHRHWDDEVAFLDRLFEDSSAYTVGPTNGDHWLLYLTPPQDDVLFPDVLQSSKGLGPSNPLSTTLQALGERYSAERLAPPSPRLLPPAKTIRPSRPDQTLEILMSQLDPAACQSFYAPENTTESAHELGRKLSDSLGLTELLPEAALDAYLFSPCGYSSNTVFQDTYSTIHVTPESDYSYASFETNIDFSSPPSSRGILSADPSVDTTERYKNNMLALIRAVLAIFRPAKMSITLFVSHDDEDEEGTQDDESTSDLARVDRVKQFLMRRSVLDSYTRIDRILYEFDGYSLVYVVFEKRRE